LVGQVGADEAEAAAGLKPAITGQVAAGLGFLAQEEAVVNQGGQTQPAGAPAASPAHPGPDPSPSQMDVLGAEGKGPQAQVAGGLQHPGQVVGLLSPHAERAIVAVSQHAQSTPAAPGPVLPLLHRPTPVPWVFI